jgi:translation initiation factor 2 gamma subunit (eIF-2gamma)
MIHGAMIHGAMIHGAMIHGAMIHGTFRLQNEICVQPGVVATDRSRTAACGWN